MVDAPGSNSTFLARCSFQTLLHLSSVLRNSLTAGKCVQTSSEIQKLFKVMCGAYVKTEMHSKAMYSLKSIKYSCQSGYRWLSWQMTYGCCWNICENKSGSWGHVWTRSPYYYIYSSVGEAEHLQLNYNCFGLASARLQWPFADDWL